MTDAHSAPRGEIMSLSPAARAYLVAALDLAWEIAIDEFTDEQSLRARFDAAEEVRETIGERRFLSVDCMAFQNGLDHARRRATQRGQPRERAELRLVWYQRPDGYWNAACACHATIAGWAFEDRAGAEAGHFAIADKERARRAGTPSQIPDCGPKIPDPDPNHPEPPVFP